MTPTRDPGERRAFAIAALTIAAALLPLATASPPPSALHLAFDAARVELAAGQPALLHATLVDDDGAPVPGASVTLAPTGARSVTNDEGRATFRVASDSARALVVTAHASGADADAGAYVLWTAASIVSLDAPTRVDPGQVAFVTLRAVLLPNGTPLSGASITLAAADVILDGATTENDGTATLRAAQSAAGVTDLTVTFDDPRYASAERHVTIRWGGDLPPTLEAVELAYTSHQLTATPRNASDPDGTPITFHYAWLANGTALPDHTATIATRANVSYEARVTADDGQRQSAPAVARFTTPPNVPPILRMDVATEARKDGFGAFDASASTDPDGTIIWARWSFSDGVTMSGLRASRLFPTPGTFSGAVEIVDEDGAIATGGFTVHVASPPPPPAPPAPPTPTPTPPTPTSQAPAAAPNATAPAANESRPVAPPDTNETAASGPATNETGSEAAAAEEPGPVPEARPAGNGSPSTSPAQTDVDPQPRPEGSGAVDPTGPIPTTIDREALSPTATTPLDATHVDPGKETSASSPPAPASAPRQAPGTTALATILISALAALRRRRSPP